jgi:hypothetical protein
MRSKRKEKESKSSIKRGKILPFRAEIILSAEFALSSRASKFPLIASIILW